MPKKILTLAWSLWRRYTRHDVSHQSAALAYFLLFSLFPILILVSICIQNLDVDLSGLLSTLSHILPESVLILIEYYIDYASEHIGRSLLYFSLIFSIWFPMRATDCLMHAVRLAYSLSEPQRPFIHRLKVLLYTVLLLLSLSLTALVAALSRGVLAALTELLGLPGEFARIWGILRFAALGLIVFGALTALYAIAQDRRVFLAEILPGAALSTLAWITLSAVYSFYTDFFANYDLVYGALSAVAVVLIWLYLSAIALIMGAEFNAALAWKRRRKAASSLGLPAGRFEANGSKTHCSRSFRNCNGPG